MEKFNLMVGMKKWGFGSREYDLLGLFCLENKGFV